MKVELSGPGKIRASLQAKLAPAELALTVYGHPEPAGSKRAFARPGGFARVVDANAKAAPWKAAVAAAAAEAWAGRELLDVALDVRMVFYRPRPRSHYGTGRNAELLRPRAPAWPTGRPDVLKLARAVEDALTGIVYRDDALIAVECLEKRWGTPERVEIEVVLALAVSGLDLGGGAA